MSDDNSKNKSGAQVPSDMMKFFMHLGQAKVIS